MFFYQPLAQRQELFQFFDDPFLLGKGWERQKHIQNTRSINPRNYALSLYFKISYISLQKISNKAHIYGIHPFNRHDLARYMCFINIAKHSFSIARPFTNKKDVSQMCKITWRFCPSAHDDAIIR